MDRSSNRLNLDHLKKQAKELVRLYRQRSPTAFDRLRRALPACAGRSDDEIASFDLRLHDAQSGVAREYGFASWRDLRRYIEIQSVSGKEHADRVLGWLRFAYSGDVSGTANRARPALAVRMFAESPDLAANDPYLACAIGDETVLKHATATDPEWVNRPGGPLLLPSLFAVAHSSLLQEPQFRERLHRCARFLLASGADPNQRVGNRWPPASLERPDDRYPLSALLGAAGSNHDIDLTKLLLDAGADPNDGESLYHSLDTGATTRLLLQHGAHVAGSNVIYHALDFDNVEILEQLLRHGGDPNEPARNAPLTDFGSPLLWAIRRRRSRRCIETLLNAGADPRAMTPDGVDAYRLAQRFGLGEVADVLRGVIDPGAESDEEQFIAACARGDEAEARRIRQRRPDLPAVLPARQLRLLPDMTAEGDNAGVRLMVSLDWPIAVRGGDWDASALNLAVFRGDSALTRFLLEHGAAWTEQHGYGDDVSGTLSWASCNEPVDGGDWVGCARALRDHGMPRATPDRDGPEWVVIGGRRKRFSEEVSEILLGDAA